MWGLCRVGMGTACTGMGWDEYMCGDGVGMEKIAREWGKDGVTSSSLCQSRVYRPMCIS